MCFYRRTEEPTYLFNSSFYKKHLTLRNTDAPSCATRQSVKEGLYFRAYVGTGKEISQSHDYQMINEEWTSTVR